MNHVNASVLRVGAVKRTPSAPGRPVLPRAGSTFRADLSRGHARAGQIPFPAEKLVRGTGMKAQTLARTPRVPLEG